MRCAAAMRRTSDLNVTDLRPPLATRHNYTLCAVDQ